MEPLAAALWASLPALPELGFGSTSGLAGLLREAPQDAPSILQKALQRAAGAASGQPPSPTRGDFRLVVGVDQLEELFTTGGVDETERRAFVAALTAMARCGFIWVVATLRSDFYPAWVASPELVQLETHSPQFDLLQPSRLRSGR